MSQVKTNSIVDLSGGSNAVLYGVANPPNSMGFRNRLLNGDMRIDQRNAGASISFPAGDGNYCLDRWRLQRQGSATGTIQQSTTAPTGFTTSLKVTVSSGAAPSAGDFYTVGQIIEGFNCADLMWGTANAVAVTIGFWVNSSVTGTYSASVYNWNAGSNTYPATFTVNVANTWEFKTVNIPGATAGTWSTNNLGSIYLRVDLGSGSNYSTATANAWNASGLFRTNGSVNFMATSSATFYLTGVQLEAGTNASNFERRDYGRELMMCQRYYEQLPAGGYGAVGVRTTDWYGYIPWQVEKRAAPTVSLTTTINIVGSVGDINTQTPTGIDQASTKSVRIYRSGSSFTSQAGTFYVPDALKISAEL